MSEHKLETINVVKGALETLVEIAKRNTIGHYNYLDYSFGPENESTLETQSDLEFIESFIKCNDIDVEEKRR